MTDLNEPKLEYRLKLIQLILGVGLLIFLLIFDAYVKAVPIYVIAIPGFLVGIDLRDILLGKGNKDGKNG